MKYGTHGTCRSRADLIVGKQNFNAPTVRAYAGPGAYFWEYEDTFDVAKELAELWWLHSKVKGFYKEEKDEGLAVVGVEINHPVENEFLDATGHKFNNALNLVLQAYKDVEDINVHEITAMVIDDLAVERNCNIVLVKTMVKPPPLAKGHKQTIVQRSVQAWPVLVVREGGEKLFSKIFAIQ